MVKLLNRNCIPVGTLRQPRIGSIAFVDLLLCCCLAQSLIWLLSRNKTYFEPFEALNSNTDATHRQRGTRQSRCTR